jgi:hypothetical protein
MRTIYQLVLLLAMTLCAASNVEARRWRHYGYAERAAEQNTTDDQARNRALQRAAAPQDARGSAFGPTVEQLLRGCNQEALDLANWPLQSVAQTVTPDDGQRDALEQMRAEAAEAGNSLASQCPKEIPARLTARLDALEHVLDAFAASLDAVRPAIERFYGALNDEQKARLVALYMSSGSAQEPSGRPRGVERNGRPGVDAADRKGDDICGRWAAALRSWPIRTIETSMPLSDLQRATLYELTGAIYRAAGTLAASCPTETSFTPLGQIDAKRKRVTALRQAIGDLHGALDRFAATIDGAQQTRLGDVVNAIQIKPPRRRGDDDD